MATVNSFEPRELPHFLDMTVRNLVTKGREEYPKMGLVLADGSRNVFKRRSWIRFQSGLQPFLHALFFELPTFRKASS
jgi:hypothetical protein